MVDAVALAPGPWSVRSAFDIVDLSCGRLILWAGGPIPDAPVVPSPFAPGDCAR